MKLSTCLLALMGVGLLGCDTNKSTTTSSTTSDAREETGSAGEITEKNLGMPFYPGATVVSDRSFAVKTPNEELYTGVFTSTDSIDTIAAFYTEKVKGLEFNKIENGGAVSMFSKELFDDRKGKLSVTLLRKSADAPVEISLAWGKTK